MIFFKILCRNSIKRHWNIKVHLKYRSCMFVKTPKYDFLIFPRFPKFQIFAHLTSENNRIEFFSFIQGVF